MKEAKLLTMKQKILTSTFLTSQVILISGYIFVYLIRVFVMWDFMNPFDWIIDIPRYNVSDRGAILSGFTGVQILVFGISNGITKEYKDKINKSHTI